MKTTIDSAGRVVIPKRLRDAVGLRAGQPLDIDVVDGRIRIGLATTPVQLEQRGTGVVAVPVDELPALTAEQVRETLEGTRR